MTADGSDVKLWIYELLPWMCCVRPCSYVLISWEWHENSVQIKTYGP